MKKRYSEEQIIGFLKEAESGIAVKELCRRHSSAMLDSPRRPSSTMRIFSSAEYCRRVARRMSRMAFSVLSFFLVIIVPLWSDDEPKVSLIQTPQLVRVSLTGNNFRHHCRHFLTSGCKQAILPDYAVDSQTQPGPNSC